MSQSWDLHAELLIWKGITIQVMQPSDLVTSTSEKNIKNK